MPNFTSHQDAALRTVADWLKEMPRTRNARKVFRLFGIEFFIGDLSKVCLGEFRQEILFNHSLVIFLGAKFFASDVSILEFSVRLFKRNFRSFERKVFGFDTVNFQSRFGQ